jgi:hypothetical protein
MLVAQKASVYGHRYSENDPVIQRNESSKHFLRLRQSSSIRPVISQLESGVFSRNNVKIMLKSSIIILSLCVLHISSTEDFVRTKPTESWMHEKDADEFTVECYRLGRIGIRFVSFIDLK